MKFSKALIRKAKEVSLNIKDFRSGEKFNHYGKNYVLRLNGDTGYYSLYVDDGYSINMIKLYDFRYYSYAKNYVNYEIIFDGSDICSVYVDNGTNFIHQYDF